MKIIELIISPTGQIRLETHGFNGPACQDASRFLRQTLGPTTAAQLTSEYHQLTDTLSTEVPQSN